MATPARILDRIDRVFDALDRGELETAEKEMELVRRKAADTAERHAAEAALAEAREDLEGALTWLASAAELAPEWSVPVAETGAILLAMGDAEGALEAADRALTRFGELHDEERGPALLTRAQALFELGRDEDCAAALADLLELPIEDPDALLEIGTLRIDLTDAEGAIEPLEAALELDPESADAWTALGVALFQTDEEDRAIEAWLRARSILSVAPRPEWRLDDDAIEALAVRTLEELPEEVRARLRDVPILVSDLPSEEMVRDGVNPQLLGLFTGTPLPEKSVASGGGETSPDACHVFVRNLERECGSKEELEDEVRITILHETAHFFGLEDEDLEELGLG